MAIDREALESGCAYIHRSRAPRIASRSALSYARLLPLIHVHVSAGVDDRYAHPTAVRPADAKVVYSAGHSLLSYMKALRKGTLAMVLTNPATSLPTATIDATYDLLFALRNATP